MAMGIQTAGDGSHLPVLIKIMSLTKGAVLELGMGTFSTPFLHWACYPEKRRLVSYDNVPDLLTWSQSFINEYHQIYLVEDWDSIDLSEHWSVALVDHAPTGRRRHEIRKLADHADYVIVHDSQPDRERWQKYEHIYPLFKYRKDFGLENPMTTVLSNFKDLNDL
jgi:hypothetical protein